MCLIRLVFQGQLLCQIKMKDIKSNQKQLLIYKPKSREGSVDRIHDANTIIGKDLFQKETDLSLFVGMTVQLETGEIGVIEGSFGKSGKFKVHFRDGLDALTKLAAEQENLKAAENSASSNTEADLTDTIKKKKKRSQKTAIKCKMYLRFKKYLFADDRKLMIQ